jgi:hypothetical protein
MKRVPRSVDLDRIVFLRGRFGVLQRFLNAQIFWASARGFISEDFSGDVRGGVLESVVFCRAKVVRAEVMVCRFPGRNAWFCRGRSRAKAFGGAAPLEKTVLQWGSPEKKQRKERVGAGT